MIRGYLYYTEYRKTKTCFDPLTEMNLLSNIVFLRSSIIVCMYIHMKYKLLFISISQKTLMRGTSLQAMYNKYIPNVT